jgi:hypothetical protein
LNFFASISNTKFAPIYTANFAIWFIGGKNSINPPPIIENIIKYLWMDGWLFNTDGAGHPHNFS